MKYLVILFLYCSTAKAQNYNQVKQFVNEIMANNQLRFHDEAIVGNNIIYADSVGQHAIAFMLRAFQKPNSANIYRYNPWLNIRKITDSLVLSPEELLFIKNEINKMSAFKWPGDLQSNSRVIASDTLTKIFAGDNYKAWDVLSRKGLDDIYHFGTPIFLRDNTYCMFYYGHSCGSRCGAGEFVLFKKINGKWRYWARMSSWVS